MARMAVLDGQNTVLAVLAIGQRIELMDIVPPLRVDGASPGWADGVYRVAAVTDYTPPAGRIASGVSSFAWDGGSGTVVETMQAIDPPLSEPSPQIVAMAHMSVSDGAVGIIDTNSGIAGAFRADVGSYWVFFVNEQPNTDYIALVYDGGVPQRAFVAPADKATSYFVVSVTDMNGAPADPTDLSIEIKRAG